jgi:hypothetical protein
MRHTVEIADTDGNTMQLSVYVDEIDSGGSWRSITKGMIKHNSGPVEQGKDNWGVGATDLYVEAGGYWGIKLNAFIRWDTVNDEGTGRVDQTWVIGLKPGDIEWSIV